MNKEILQKAIEVYGEEPQIRQCMEECAELISAMVSIDSIALTASLGTTCIPAQTNAADPAIMEATKVYLIFCFIG